MQPTRVDRNGRVLVPAAIRRELGLREGSELLIELDAERRVVMVTPEDAWATVQALFDAVPRGSSVVDELIAERRAEARREEEEEEEEELGGADVLCGR